MPAGAGSGSQPYPAMGRSVSDQRPSKIARPRGRTEMVSDAPSQEVEESLSKTEENARIGRADSL